MSAETTTEGTPAPLLDLPSRDPAFRPVLDTAQRVAPTPATVLLLGESGTGKSLLARAIHRASAVREGAFVTVSCPSLSGDLLESELFGHRKGAFTGALRDHWGKVSAAHGGTLFLDEIGDLPLSLQPKLLRLLQEREYELVGDTKTQRAEVRIIAATNQDLKERVESGTFRSDLFYRLSVVALNLPPLRDRPDDLASAADHFLTKYSREFGKAGMQFTREAREMLLRHAWPGNFRELENAIQRAVLTSPSRSISPPALGLNQGSSSPLPRVGSPISLTELEASHIREVVERSATLEQAASILEIDNSTLFRKRKKYAI